MNPIISHSWSDKQNVQVFLEFHHSSLCEPLNKLKLCFDEIALAYASDAHSHSHTHTQALYWAIKWNYRLLLLSRSLERETPHWVDAPNYLQNQSKLCSLQAEIFGMIIQRNSSIWLRILIIFDFISIWKLTFRLKLICAVSM